MGLKLLEFSGFGVRVQGLGVVSTLSLQRWFCWVAVKNLIQVTNIGVSLLKYCSLISVS